MPADAANAAREVLDFCRAKGLTVTTAESCTGGLVAAALTSIAGSSAVVDRGFVTYSNDAKETMLGVPRDTIARFGAVSEQTARAMATGALAHSPADLAVAVTGVAGPGGGTFEKPVGLVHFACALRGGDVNHQRIEYGDVGRANVRHKSLLQALEMLREMAETVRR